MRRQAIIMAAVCLAVLAGVLPMFATYQIQRDRALKSEQNHLDEYARWTWLRADRTLTDAKQTLARVAAEGRADCSPAHVARLRDAAMNSNSVSDIGYLRDGRLACTTLGPVADRVPRKKGVVDLGDGYTMSLPVKPSQFEGKPMVVLYHGDYNALIKPERLVDVLTDTTMTLGVTTLQGVPLALSGKLDPVMARDIIAHGGSGADGQYIFASTRAHGFAAFAITDHANARADLDVGMRDILPMSLAVSAILVGMVIWVSRQRLAPEKELEAAIRKREFVAHYQPIIELSTGRCIAAEALIRWRRPDGSWMLPDLFIPMAEKTGLISQLTAIVIARVTDEMDHLLRADRDLHISINISPTEMEDGSFLPQLTEAVRKARIEPSQIWLEITERGFMNARAATQAIEKARNAGFVVTIDDFGTGYSSLSLLEGLPLDALKIDKSFVDAIGRDAATSVVTPHIIAMAHGLKLSMIAEGVEAKEQEAFLQEAGVEFAQGWLYSKALPPDEFAAFYRERSSSS